MYKNTQTFRQPTGSRAELLPPETVQRLARVRAHMNTESGPIPLTTHPRPTPLHPPTTVTHSNTATEHRNTSENQNRIHILIGVPSAIRFNETQNRTD